MFCGAQRDLVWNSNVVIFALRRSASLSEFLPRHVWAIPITLSGLEQDPASLWVVATAEVCPPTSHLCRFSGRTQGGCRSVSSAFH